MKIIIPFLGKTKAEYLQKGIKDYCNRLNHYTRVEIKELKLKKSFSAKTDFELKRQENELINSCLEKKTFRIALDIKGKQFRSEAFSDLLTRLENRGVQQAAFIIGGPVGLAEEQLDMADMVISLSSMTFPHDIARFLLVEQLYRAYTIKAGEKYHK